MIARRWAASIAVSKVLIDPIELLHHGWDVVEEELRFGEELAREAAACERGDGQAGPVRREDVVRRVAGDEGSFGPGPDSLQRGLKDLRRRLRKLRISLRRR